VCQVSCLWFLVSGPLSAASLTGRKAVLRKKMFNIQCPTINFQVVSFGGNRLSIENWALNIEHLFRLQAALL
jgi:hypothetical protein